MKKLLYLVCILSLAVILSAPLTTMAKKLDGKQYHVVIDGPDISGDFYAKSRQSWECALTFNY